jgi:hypothetical protein
MDRGRSGPIVKTETRYDDGEGHMVWCRQGLAEVGPGPVGAGRQPGPIGAEMKFP